MKSTIDYYDENAALFCEDTVAIDMQSLYDKFEAFLHPKASILDCGCGSGRDSKYFMHKDYSVTAMDGSIELCKKAHELTSLEVKHMYFKDIAYENQFDGIWACASLLHVSSDELPAVMCKLRHALKSGGVLYASFKYGDFEGKRNGRYFTDMTDARLTNLLSGISDMQVLDTWITSDVREGRSSERWLNTIIRK